MDAIEQVEAGARRLSEILPLLKGQRQKLRDEFGVQELAVFGSYVRGEQHAQSDLDLLVTFDPMPGLLKLCHLQNELSDLLCLQVDLVEKTSLREFIRPEVEREKVIV